MAGRRTAKSNLLAKGQFKIGDKVLIKTTLRRKNHEVFEVVEIVTVTIMNEQKRLQNIHISNLELV